MRSISENDLSAVIPLLAAKIRDVRRELLKTEGRQKELSDEEFDERTDAQDLLASYERTMNNLREEYQAARAEGTILPSFEDLTAPFKSD